MYVRRAGTLPEWTLLQGAAWRWYDPLSASDAPGVQYSGQTSLIGSLAIIPHSSDGSIIFNNMRYILGDSAMIISMLN